MPRFPAKHFHLDKGRGNKRERREGKSANQIGDLAKGLDLGDGHCEEYQSNADSHRKR